MGSEMMGSFRREEMDKKSTEQNVEEARTESNIRLVASDGSSHGSHWGTVFPDVNKLQSYFQPRLSRSHPFVTNVQVFANLGEQKIIGHQIALSNEVRAYFAMVDLGKPEMATGYPVFPSTCKFKFVTDEIKIWPIQIEAWISGRVDDAALTFFPVDFFVNKRFYFGKRNIDVSLSLLAYSQKLNPFAGQTVKDKDGRELKLDKMEGIFPARGFENPITDDYKFYGKVEHVQEANILGDPVLITRMHCNPIGEIESVCLMRNSSGIPQVDDILGIDGWLQGRLV